MAYKTSSLIKSFSRAISNLINLFEIFIKNQMSIRVQRTRRTNWNITDRISRTTKIYIVAVRKFLSFGPLYLKIFQFANDRFWVLLSVHERLIIWNFNLKITFRNRIRIHSSGYEPFAAFSAAVFSFLSSNSTYLYCTVRLCRAQSSNCNSSCGATSSSWKQKRSTSNDEINETDEINLKLGPLLINNQKSKRGF